jgi:hypothetical protein
VKRIVFGFACLLAAFACRENPLPASSAAKPADAESAAESPPLENDNLLNTVFGATVIERDNEVHYESSAAHSIDGMFWTSWTAAPGGTLSGTFALAAPTRLRRLGVTLPVIADRRAATITIDASLDGTKWFPALRQTFPQDSDAARLFDITPIAARYLRVSLDTTAPVSVIKSIHAIGEETEPFVQPEIEGCWEINFEPARFIRSGARVIGTIGGMTLDGGTDGRVYRFMWLEQATWGYAAVAISPDGNRLTGTRWHEAIGPDHLGDGWMGQRVPCAPNGSIDLATTAGAILDRAGSWRMYAMDYDLAARLIRERPGKRFRVVARNFLNGGADKNRIAAESALIAVEEALRARGADRSRVEFVNAGSTADARTDSTPRRVMDSAVELQALPPR